MGAYETAISECHDPESLRREVFRLRDERDAAEETLLTADNIVDEFENFLETGAFRSLAMMRTYLDLYCQRRNRMDDSRMTDDAAIETLKEVRR